MVRSSPSGRSTWRSTDRRVVALGIRSVLAIPGAAEARRLSRADAPAARQPARQLGLTRTVVAGLFLVRSTLLPRLLGIEGAGASESWLPRLFAVRELVISAGAIADSASIELP
jgi:hypothetical protein